MKKIRVAIAGLGRLGRVHAENLAFRIPNAELCAVCAQTEDSLNWARECLDICACYQDFAEMLAKETPDAVVLVTPSDLHCEQIELALDAGVHVFFEKPLERTRPAALPHRRLRSSIRNWYVCRASCGATTKAMSMQSTRSIPAPSARPI